MDGSPVDLERFRRDLDGTRDRLGLSWNALAGMAGVSAAMFTRLNGGSAISLDAFARLCGACRLDPGDYMPAAEGRAWSDVRHALERVPGIGSDTVEDIVGYARAAAIIEGHARTDDNGTARGGAWAIAPAIPDPDPADIPMPDGTDPGTGIGM